MISHMGSSDNIIIPLYANKGKGLRFIVLYHVSTFRTTLQFTSYPPSYPLFL